MSYLETLEGHKKSKSVSRSVPDREFDATPSFSVTRGNGKTVFAKRHLSPVPELSLVGTAFNETD
jgi:hypothetical protein